VAELSGFLIGCSIVFQLFGAADLQKNNIGFLSSQFMHKTTVSSKCAVA
jgi:hypothetical protein